LPTLQKAATAVAPVTVIRLRTPSHSNRITVVDVCAKATAMRKGEQP